MKITCDIINDLIPSYVDEICTEDSRKLVEEHIRICDNCHQKLNYMRNPIECPEILNLEKRWNPFLKIKRRNRIKLIIAVVATICIISGGMFAIQEIGTLHDYFYPSMEAVIENEVAQSDWIRVGISDDIFLNFDSIFYGKEVVNDANSSGNVTIRILDETKKIILEETTIEPGNSIKLDKLEKNQNYIVEAKCNKGRFFLNFI